jgi:predicted dehydrogenase
MIRVGIVGTGGMGIVHYNNYAHIEDCKVTALVGITQQSQECAAQWGLPLYESIPAMAQAQKLDVVDICSPTFMHKQHVMESLNLGLHAITEKPAALHKKDAAEMFDLAEKNGKLLFVAQVLQFTKEVELLHSLIQSGEYGKVLDASFERLSACPRWIQNGWLFDKEKSGLLPFDLHIHDLDVIVSLFGKPESFSYSSAGGENKSYKEHYRFIYSYKDLSVAAEAAWFNADFPFTARWRVYFENAVVVNEGTRVVAYQFDQPLRVFDTEEKIKIPTGINVPPTGMYLNELSHFIDCIKRGVPSEKVSRKQIMTVIEILEEITAAEN